MILTSSKSPYNIDDCRKFIEQLKSKDPELLAEYEEKYAGRGEAYENVDQQGNAGTVYKSVMPVTAKLKPESIVAHFRPVLIIRDNKVVPEFAGDEVQFWKTRIMDHHMVLDRVIPSVGRIEVNNNAEYPWVGTGWLVDTDIIVTNRHVADHFCHNKAGFSFKIGFPKGTQSARLDFLEEYQDNKSFEFDVESVLWMAEDDGVQPDIAFMRLKQNSNGAKIPTPIPLAKTINEDEVVVTIGYPAHDPEFPNQELERLVFKDVYDKKRLAPGKILKITDNELSHDCSTLGGNSGSAVISLATGEAIGLHFAGVYMSANYAVPAQKISELLDQLKKGTLSGMRSPEHNVMDTKPKAQSITNSLGSYSFEFNIPVKITVEIAGNVLQASSQNPNLPLPSLGKVSEKEALDAAILYFKDWPDVRNIRMGYRFERDWITDERVIIVEVVEKKKRVDLINSNTPMIPALFKSFGVDVRSADIFSQLEDLNINLLEAAPRAGGYKEPPNLSLTPVKERMSAIFHVSPDSGFPNLSKFIKRVTSNLTATMYEWDKNHISDTIFEAINKPDVHLKMVTQRAGTKVAVEDMKKRLKDKFEHVYASVGTGKLIPKSYHIKVASRDRKEFWLSSGNWKDSNQADINPAGENSKLVSPLREHNREWHVIIENPTLAALFEDYIKWDFQEATRVPLKETVEAKPIWLIVPQEIEEAKITAKYFDPLIIRDRVLDIQPLLTPDRDDRSRRMFLVFATALIQQAQTSIAIQNQSLSLLDENNEDFERFFTVLKQKQKDGVRVQIIMRHFDENPGISMNAVEKLKDFGINTNDIKVQLKCHTKAIIVDHEDQDKAAVLFGSHNFTNTGALFNRDASLLVKDAEVARYFRDIFDYDWENLAKQIINDKVKKIRIAEAGEMPAIGFKKVLLSSLLGEII